MPWQNKPTTCRWIIQIWLGDVWRHSCKREMRLALLENHPTLLLTEPPVKPITIHTPPALELHVRRRKKSGCLHYSRAAAVETAAVQRWWWNWSVHSVAESDFRCQRQSTLWRGTGTLMFFINQNSGFHAKWFLSSFYLKKILFVFCQWVCKTLRIPMSASWLLTVLVQTSLDSSL